MKHVIYRKHHMVNDFVHVRVSQGYRKGLPAEVLRTRDYKCFLWLPPPLGLFLNCQHSGCVPSLGTVVFSTGTLRFSNFYNWPFSEVVYN